MRTLALLSSLAALLGSVRAQEPAPCDAALLTGKRPQPVFVRMQDQRFSQGGAFEAFCREHATTPRSQLRKETIADLHRRADGSWGAVREVVGVLVQGARVLSVVRGAPDGGHGGVAGRSRVPGGAGAAVGAVAAVSGAASVCV